MQQQHQIPSGFCIFKSNIQFMDSNDDDLKRVSAVKFDLF